jgi:hypothetical protein
MFLQKADDNFRSTRRHNQEAQHWQANVMPEQSLNSGHRADLRQKSVEPGGPLCTDVQVHSVLKSRRPTLAGLLVLCACVFI